jgi:hypothetical protein
MQPSCSVAPGTNNSRPVNGDIAARLGGCLGGPGGVTT